MAAGGERQPFRSRPFGRGAVRQRAACRNTVVRGRRSVAEERAELGRGAVRPASGRKRIAGAVRLQELVQQLYRSDRDRSEEPTSELQSLMRISYAVFCLKKQTYNHKERCQQNQHN